MKRKIEQINLELIYKINDTIYFSDCVTKRTTKILLNILDNLTDEHDEYKLVIDSNGGCVESGIKIYKFIKKSKYKINTVATGLVGGIAILILLAGEQKSMTEFCKLFICDISSSSNGSYLELIAQSNYISELKKTIDDIILNNTCLTQSQLNDFTNCGKFMTSDESLKYKFIGKIEK